MPCNQMSTGSVHLVCWRTICAGEWQQLNSACQCKAHLNPLFNYQPCISQDGIKILHFLFEILYQMYHVSFILHYTDYKGVCPEEFHSLSIFKAWNLLAGLSPGHMNSSAIYIYIYIYRRRQLKRPLLTIYLWSQSSGNKLATLKQLKALRLNISSLDRYCFWVLFFFSKVRREEIDTVKNRK